MAAVNTYCPIITLTTDYGLRDNYTGIVKGIIAYLNPAARVIDVSGGVPPFNIEAGRYLIETSYRDFPPGTIHLAVIDPGVGTRRKSILIETQDYLFIGPDNGLFSFLDQKQVRKAVSITKKKYFLKDVSPTFHGRDVFAPVASYLSRGVAPEEFGRKVRTIVRLKRSRFKRTRQGLSGRVIYIDHFGNLVTSFKAGDLPKEDSLVFLNDRKIGRLRRTFGAVRIGRPLCYVNSFGYLEIAVNRESAAEYYRIDYMREANILIAPP